MWEGEINTNFNCQKPEDLDTHFSNVGEEDHIFFSISILNSAFIPSLLYNVSEI